MEIKVNYLDNLRQEAKFDDFTVIADQPIRYKGDGSAPGPFDYFLASSAFVPWRRTIIGTEIFPIFL